MDFPITNLLSGDLSAIILKDAQDTYKKLVEFYPALAALATIIDDGEITNDEAKIIYEYFAQFPGNAITMVDEEGDLVVLKMETRAESVDDVTANNVSIAYGVPDTDDSTQTVFHPVLQSGEVITTAISDAAGELHSLNSLLSSISNQLQASEVMSRLSTLALTNQVTPENISAVFADIRGQMSSPVAQLHSQLCSAVGTLNADSLVNILRRVYSDGYSAAVGKEHKIEFADDDYSVKSYYGSILNGIITTGVEALGVLLTYSLGAVGWILNSVGSFIVSAVDAARSTVNTESVAKFEYSPTSYTFIKPVFQGSVSKSYFGDEIANSVTLGPIVVKTPFFDAFMWDAGGGKANCEIYANVMLTGAAQNVAAFNRNICMWKHDTDGTTLSLRYTVDKSYNGIIDDDIDPATDNNFCPYLELTGYLDNPALSNVFYKLLNPQSTDDDLRYRTWVSLFSLVWWLENVRNSTQATPQGSYFTAPVFSAIPEYNGQWTRLPIFSQAVFDMIETGATPSWDVLVNRIIPDIGAEYFEDPYAANPTFWARLLGDSESSYLPSKTRFIREAIGYRDSFAITPPTYTPNALVNTLLTTAALTTMSVGVALVGMKARKKLRTFVDSRRALTQEMYNNYITPGRPGYHDPEYFKQYVRKSRQTNFLSGIVGTSTVLPLNATSYEGGFGALSIGEFGELDTINNDQAAEQNQAVTLSLEDLKLLITGPIPPTPGEDMLSPTS